MLGTVFILNILQKGLLVLGSMECIVLRINIHSLVSHSKRSQLPKRIEDMCRNEKHAHRCSHFSMVIGQLLSSYLHREEYVFLPCSRLLSQSSHYVVHVYANVGVHCNTVMHCDCTALRHPQGPISKWSQYFNDILNNGPFILSCEKSPVISIFWILEQFAWEFPESVGVLDQLQCWVPMCLHIHDR